MDVVDLNGGNAELMPNLEKLSNPNTIENDPLDIGDDMIGQDEEDSEVNGEVKNSGKKGTPGKRKMRKSKANSTSTIESGTKPKTRGQKRKLSEREEVSSEESMEFNGFDVQSSGTEETSSHILKKLIAEAESAEPPKNKRPKRSLTRNATKISEITGSNDKMLIDDDINQSMKKESEEKSETDSIGAPNSIESENDHQKTEESSMKSANSSVNSSPSAISQKSKASRLSRGASPGSAIKQKVVVDLSNPAFKEPFKYGWKRELVYRAGSENSLKRMGDIYYYTPKGKKVRSFREVSEFLTTKELTIDNFTFFKEPIGIDDPEKEIIREAKRIKDSTPSMPARKSTAKKATPAKKVVKEEPPPSPGRTIKGPSTAIKIKLPAKKAAPKVVETKPPVEESEMLPPQWSSPTARRSQPAVEKPSPAKSKKAIKAKVQEPCSIRCSSSMGLIPSLQCRVCLCLYHPECVDGAEFSGGDDYVCKNCQQDSEDSYEQQHQQISQSLTPPPLIPISMLGAQNTKSKHPLNSTPPKLQRIPKSDSQDSQTRNAQKVSRSITNQKSPVVEKNEGSWYTHARNELLHSCDGSLPKPAQNIALMAGKKYIVVPKNNAMAVQPAITVKQDKIGDKPPLLKESSPTEVSNTTENSLASPMLSRGLANKLSKAEQDKYLNDGVEFFSRNNLTDLEKSASNDDSYERDVIGLGKVITEPKKISDKKTTTDSVESSISNDETSTKTDSIKGEVVKRKKFKRMSLLSTYNANKGLDHSLSGDKSLGCTQNHNNSKGLEITLTLNKKRQQQLESDRRQHFMVSVCAGYHALSRVFQYLKVQELLRAARVCKMWRDLAAHPALWKTVRMKNSQVTDWEGLADSLKRHGTQHLDLRKMLVVGESDDIWKKFVTVIPRVTSLIRLELCRCPVSVVQDVIKNCPQLEVLSAMTIKCDSLNLESAGNLKHCQELKLKAISGMSLIGDLTPLQELTQLTHLSLTSVKELGKKRIDVIESLTNLETLELGECSDFPEKFGTVVLLKLQKLERLRLEKGQGSCCTFDILDGVSKLDQLIQLELVNFDVKNGFDKYLANCKNIKRLLIIPTYISQSATSNNMVLGGVTELSNNLTHFVWGVTLELLRVTELFIDQCNQMNKQITGDSIPVLKPVPCLKLIEEEEKVNDEQQGDEKQPSLTNPQVDILPLPQLQKLLLTALPKTRVKILKIPFHATWRQSISDSTTQ
ncbi:titin homolog [Athalia rosae]|uniref:titin homolog n=1 Tax=Athalia rosae TaxID=37344 RepID=UPI00203473DA|nr:titin homolog [Athalia rosae]